MVSLIWCCGGDKERSWNVLSIFGELFWRGNLIGWSKLFGKERLLPMVFGLCVCWGLERYGLVFRLEVWAQFSFGNDVWQRFNMVVFTLLKLLG